MWHQITRQQKVLALTARVELTLSRFYAGKKTQRNSLAAAAAFLNPAPKKLGQLDRKSLHFFRDASTNSNLSQFFFAFHFEPGIEKIGRVFGLSETMSNRFDSRISGNYLDLPPIT